jgi:hypothetical protein
MCPQVAVYHKVTEEASLTSRWVYLDYKAPHTHDVRTLAVLPGQQQEDNLLISGGNDGQVILYSADRFRKVRGRR